MKLERRFYQLYIIHQIKKCLERNENCIVELDAGLGKCVIMYLLAKHLPNKNILIITPSRASLADTALFFEEMSKTDKINIRFDYLKQGMPHQLRKKILEESRVVLSTPITLTRTLSRYSELTQKWDLVIINEVDKIIKRIAYAEETSDIEGMAVKLTTANRFSVTKRVRKTKLTYPWNELIKLIPDKCIIVGMSGTLRDKHIIHTGEKIALKEEIKTLLETVFKAKKTKIITMDELLKKTDVWRYTQRNLTIIRTIPIHDEKIQTIDKILSEEIESILKRLAKKERADDYTVIERAISLLEDEPTKFKLIRLVLARRFLVASYPQHYIQFLNKPFIKQLLERKTNKKLNELVPKESSKIKKICEIVEAWVKQGSKVAILSSFVRTTRLIAKTLKEKNLRVFTLTGTTLNKEEVLRDFKNSGDVLCFSPVGERDIDLPVDVLIIHDIIRTAKTMYQRMKRGRRSFVLITFYGGTHEERKVSSLLIEIKRKYPWTIRIYSE